MHPLYTLDDIKTNSRKIELIKEKIPIIADTDSALGLALWRDGDR